MLSELYILKGKDAGKFVKLGTEPFVFLGRSITNQVPIDDREVSRVHCRIEVRADGCRLRDLSSGNGTYVNEEKVNGEADLHDGDLIKLGKTVVTILIESPEEAQDWREFVGDTGEFGEESSPSGELLIESSPALTGISPTPDDNRAETVIVPAATRSRGDEADSDQPAPFSSEEEELLRTSEPRGKKNRVSLRDLIPNYVIERKLGGSRSSSEAVIYKASQKSLERAVAIKTLLARGEDRDKTARRFMREVSRVARLPHRNIVVIHDAGRVKNFYFFVMEYLSGGSVLDMIADGRPLPLDRSLRIAHEIAEATAYIHNHGVIHRGIHPGAILLDSASGTGKLCGFGFSKEMEMSAGDTTYLNAPLEGFAFLSPEQILGKQTTPRVDIYSLGLTLWTMLAGRMPYQGKSHIALSQSILNGELPPLSEVAPMTPAEVQALVARCVHVDAEARYEGAEALAEELRRVRLQLDPDDYYRPSPALPS